MKQLCTERTGTENRTEPATNQKPAKSQTEK
jgi:hypothetical protein